ncbi:MAG TPA: hypothetical protein VGB18_08845 [Candidatus Thermoplasmatota archaeon]
MAVDGDLVPDKTYHAQQHQVEFDTTRGALMRCLRVQRDFRTDHAGNLRHPYGYIAYCRVPPDRILRVDFNLVELGTANLLRVVTAFWVKK